ncbi:A-kinase anchor protein 12b isoform X2 [Leuresthes tenuis]|uniref:A-kinase anchor protein 12b isoform X2 n=1 Tax=Leuresthes tenuis TaxID=355514 RepID=UPI003B50227A
MGAQSSAQRDGKSQDDASASASASTGEMSAEVKVIQEGGGVPDSKPLEKNGQISSLTSLNGHSEDNTLAEVGQPDGVSVAQKEEAPETTDTIPDAVTPQINGEKVDKESPDANDISTVEEKATDEKPGDASEVGFKKIFTIVGLKFTLKKDKSDEMDPVKLLTVKDKDGEEVSETEPAKNEEAATAEEKTTEEKKADADADADASATEAEVTKDTGETAAPPEGASAEASSEGVKEEGAEKESEAIPAPKETGMSPFRKLFFVGLFSNLRKKTSVKKTKEEEEKETALKEETAKSEETAVEEKEEKDVGEKETKEEKDVAEKETKEETAVKEQETKEENTLPSEEKKEEKTVTELDTKKEASDVPVEEKSEPKEQAPTTPEEAKSNASTEVTVGTPAPTKSTTDETKQEDQKAEAGAEEKRPVEATSEAELLSSQEKTKPHGSPLKKLFTGAGLKKLSTKRQKNKKDSESKLTDSGEHAAEQLQSSTESEEAPKADSGPSSPEASGEHSNSVEVNQNGSNQETEGEVACDGDKKKDGVIASFKKLVTPKKHVKRSSDSEDEGTSDKPTKSATLSSSESATLADKSCEEEETKEEKPSEEEPKPENTEKLTSSTEETKKKMDTSVSWEALMCMGGPKKRTRRTSDSDDEETKVEEEEPEAAAEGGEQEDKNETDDVTSQNPESEGEVAPEAAPEPVSASPVRESPWSILKRLVISKNKAKVEEKPEGSSDQVQSDTEAPKDDSSFSLRKFFPGRRKKAVEKQASIEQGADEDSDTPAVVPLSEYDDQAETAQEASTELAAVQSKASAEDRSPSWIPAIIEDADDKQDQLSDIPEEAENVATPKSVDTDIGEDEGQVIPPKRTGRRLSTAEVKPITPAPSGATCPVPKEPGIETAKEIIGSIEAQISEIPPQISITLEDVPVFAASQKTEDELQIENAKSITNIILEPHISGEAMAFCTGLGTKEIAKVALEEPVEPIVENMTVVTDSLSTEVAVEEKPIDPEEADVTEDPVLKAHVHEVQTLELEPITENFECEVIEIQSASENYEPEIEKVGVVSTEHSEVIQPTTVKENSPKAVIVDPIAPTLETAVCTQTVEVSEVTVETKDMEVNIEQLDAVVENTPAEDICDNTKTTNTKGTETAIPGVVPREETAVITETVVLVAPQSGENNQQATNALAKQNGSAKDTMTTEQACKKMEEVSGASEIETQSAVIAQTVIQDAVDKVSEDVPKPQKSAKQTSTIPKPIKATATTEKEIDTENDQLVVTDTPVPVICEKPVKKSLQVLCVAMEVMESVPIEVTETMEEEEEEEQQNKGLKKAEEVKASGEIVIEEEVTKIMAKSEDQKATDKSEEKDEKDLEIHMPVQVVLQAAEVIEDPPVEVETLTGYENSSATAENPTRQSKLSVLSEEPQETAAAPSKDTEAADSQTDTEKKQSAKCAQVMAQVIEVIEEAVKEIEPLSTELTAAS